MKSLSIFLIFMLVLLFPFGNEGRVEPAAEGRICAKPVSMPNCTDQKCFSFCVRNKAASGLCQGSICLCFQPC
ncbi:hypothetical protein AB3S75_007369 [Citrus x aurantiifolia]